MAHPAYNQAHYKAASKWLEERASLPLRDGAVMCRILGPRCSYAATVPHHKVALAYGGKHGLDNLIPACKPCNQWLGVIVSRRRRAGLGPEDRDWGRFRWPEEVRSGEKQPPPFIWPPPVRHEDRPWFFGGRYRPPSW